MKDFGANMEYTILIMLALLTTKHLIIDFFLQVPFMHQNKHLWTHPGGWCHAGLHGIGTILCLIWWVNLPLLFTVALAEILIHFLTDLSKMRIGKHFGWGPNTHAEFWWAMGADQWVHSMTYIGIILAVIKI